MPSNHETFFHNSAFAVVGHTKQKNFPKLTYQGLKKLGKTVFPVDPSVDEIDGDTVYKNLTSIPEKVNAVVLEVPREETKDWVTQAAEMGIREIWIHMERETPEALEIAKEKGLNVRTGTCAVMYVTPGFSLHSFHRWIRKAMGNY